MSYHYNHTHKEKPPIDPQSGQVGVPGVQGVTSGVPILEGQAENEPGSAASSVGGGSLTPPSTPGQDPGGSMGSDLPSTVAIAGSEASKNWMQSKVYYVTVSERRFLNSNRPKEY